MTARPVRPERSGPETVSVVDLPPFEPSPVKAVFRDVTPLRVSRSAVWAAASVTRTVPAEIIDGARRAAAEEETRKSSHRGAPDDAAHGSVSRCPSHRGERSRATRLWRRSRARPLNLESTPGTSVPA